MKKNNIFNKFLLIILFLLIFVVPHIFQYQALGFNLNYDYNFNNYHKLKSYEDIILYLKKNIFPNLNIFKNQIFIFFVVAFIYQRLFLYFSK